MPLSDETLRSILAHAGGCEFDALTDEAEVVAMATDLLAARARIAEVEQERDDFNTAATGLSSDLSDLSHKLDEAEAENARLREALREAYGLTKSDPRLDSAVVTKIQGVLASALTPSPKEA